MANGESITPEQSLDMEKNRNLHYLGSAAVCVLTSVLVGCVTTPRNQLNLLPTGGPATAPKPVQKAAFSGIPQHFGYYTELNADCTSPGRPSVIVMRAPSHGSVAIENDAESYSSFESTNQRYECNKKKSPSVGVIYTSESGYVGTDLFTLKRISRHGDVLKLDYVVTVEQLPTLPPSMAPQ
jgi:hypothetical protein